MKLTKMDCTLNEKDTLLDMLDAEKHLMTLYTTALFEGSTKSVRKSISANLMGVAENQYNLYTQLSSRGYVTPAPAKKDMIDQATDSYKKQKKTLKAN
ncbi:MAG: spore coat protein [Clostridia bacterium]|nr:spore coat protein [Clostridia bacterium]